jgi:hypothetical protein
MIASAPAPRSSPVSCRWLAGTSLSMTQRQQNTSLIDQVISHVTITDPTHPLFGRTFPVVSVPARSRTNPSLLVELPTGEHRRVPRLATDLAQRRADETSSVAALLPVSARTLVPLARVVRRLLGATEESPDERPPESTASPGGDGTAALNGGADAPAQPLAGPGTGKTTLPGPVSGRTHPAPTRHAANRQRRGDQR